MYIMQVGRISVRSIGHGSRWKSNGVKTFGHGSQDVQHTTVLAAVAAAGSTRKGASERPAGGGGGRVSQSLDKNHFRLGFVPT